MAIFMETYVKDFIEEHARSNEKEIYGWLIGYEDHKRNVYICAVFDCRNYTKQTIVAAIPDLREFHMLGSALPQGIGVLGIYHSHPRNVFHSHTDDSTLNNIKQIYPNVISIVTNGYETKYFRFKDDELLPAKIKFKKIKLKESIFFESEIAIPSNCEDKIKLSTYLRDEIEKNWEKRTYWYSNKQIYSINSVSDLIGKKIFIKFPQKNFKNQKKIPFFALLYPDPTDKIEKIHEKIKIELIDDLLQKTNKSTVNVAGNGLMIPETQYIDYMGIPLKVHLIPDTIDSLPPYHLIREIKPRIKRLKEIGLKKFAQKLQNSIKNIE
ncbi:MAG: Mov34/MPN/PAD-1 family protein [Candidatus Helarchaeota archaeon]